MRAANEPNAGGRNIWDLVILVLGVNLWCALLLVPSLHLSSVSLVVMQLMLLAGAVLVGALWSRDPLMLLGGYPASLVLPLLVEPRLVGVDVLTPWTFAIVAASFVGYTVVTALLLRLMAAPRRPADCRRLSAAEIDRRRWRRGRRIYLTFAALGGLFPLVLIAALHFDEDIQTNIARYYPERAAEASVLFGVFSIGIWLLLFYRYFARPLRAHIRGDKATKSELLMLRYALRRPKPRLRFYAWVALSLVLMGVLYLTR